MVFLNPNHESLYDFVITDSLGEWTLIATGGESTLFLAQIDIDNSRGGVNHFYKWEHDLGLIKQS